VVEGFYDELTWRRIEGATCTTPRPVASRSRRAVGGGALLTAVAFGMREALEPREVEPVVEEVDAADDEASPAVWLLLVRGVPARSRALVRPWLLP